MITAFQAKYYAYELTKRNPPGSVEKFAGTLLDAQVDLNPHQVEAALFAFRSPLSRGALLADEVGLGKTIEAGIVIAQKWAERKRRILIIVPANLRKQWGQELQDKFHIPSMIMETKSFNGYIKQENFNPFMQQKVVICSYQFAVSKQAHIEAVEWDIVVIDEAHRLRNVYKPANKTGNAIKSALKNRPKLLLTATPLQNNINELFGLIGIIDDQVFGDLPSFRERFGKLTDKAGNNAFEELRQRLQPVCKRTLRRQAQEYIKYTRRVAMVEEFYPTTEEQELYELVSEYLSREELIALPKSQRMLMTMILRKLLASSTFAIAGTLAALEQRLQEGLNEQLYSEKIADEFKNNYEGYDDDCDEYYSENETGGIDERIRNASAEALSRELAELKRFRLLADSIQRNSKGEKLLTALEHGFAAAMRNGAARKAVIFTESTRTQEYLRKILHDNGFEGKTVLFNGSNNDIESKRIYREWMEEYKGSDRITGSPTADKRAALVDCFREQAEILIATEAAAEGINLQFCSLVINYDLPWNPQRIEQRIGRCHRYGQKHDVVVVNFLNKANAADQRVYELLNEKFRLFDGVFGSSDEVLGAIESGMDFEKRIAAIYQKCRTVEEIGKAFDELQREFENKISSSIQQTRQTLLENFDEEVIAKLRLSKITGEQTLDKYEQLLWRLTRYALDGYAEFDDAGKGFNLRPGYHPQFGAAKYTFDKNNDAARCYRIGSQLAQHIINAAKNLACPSATVCFDYAKHPGKISVVEQLRGKTGVMLCRRLTYEALDAEDHIVLCAICADGTPLDQDTCEQILRLPARETGVTPVNYAALEESYDERNKQIIEAADARNMNYFDEEIAKLDKWAEDIKVSLELELKQLDIEIGTKRADARKISVLKEKLAAQKEIAATEKRRHALRYNLYSEQNKIDDEKNRLIDGIAERLENKVEEEQLFVIKWMIT